MEVTKRQFYNKFKDESESNKRRTSMDFEKMSENLQKILMNAVNDAKANQHASVDTIDVLEAMFKSEILDGLFDRIDVDKKLALTIIADEEKKIVKSSSQNINLSNEVQKSIDKAAKWASQHDEIYLSVATLWIALMFNRSYISRRLVQTFNLTEKQCEEAELARRGGRKMDTPNAEDNLEALKKYREEKKLDKLITLLEKEQQFYLEKCKYFM